MNKQQNQKTKKEIKKTPDKQTEEYNQAFLESCDIAATEKKISQLQKMGAKNPCEFAAKEKCVKELEEELVHKINKYSPKKEIVPIEIFIEDLKNDGATPSDIAGRLKETYNCSSFKIGQLLPAKPGSFIANGSISRRGRKLLQNYKNKNPTP